MLNAESGVDIRDQVRAAVADAMVSLDPGRVADVLIETIQREIDPALIAGFALGPDGALQLRRFVVDHTAVDCLSGGFDFEWLEPMLAAGTVNGASMCRTDDDGLTQVAAALTAGDGRFGYLLIMGHFEDPERVRCLLASIAAEGGLSIGVIVKASERAADVAVLRERERLSRDLHDSLSQSLWSLSILSETAGSMADPEDPLHAVIGQISEISLTSQEEMRALLINLRSAQPSKEKIADVLESLVEDFRASHDLEVIASIAQADLDAEVVMAFRRIAEEALNNVGRHAKASLVAVILDVHPVLALRIGDNGVGFDTKPLEGHLGLRIMRERAAEAGCAFEIESDPATGTLVTASVDPSLTRPMPWRVEPVPPPSLRRGFWLLIGGLVLAAIAGVALLASRSDRAETAEIEIELHVLSVLEQRTLVGRASADEATSRVLEGLGVVSSDDVQRAIENRNEAVAAAVEEIEPLAGPLSVSGQYALQVLSAFSATAAVSPDERLYALYGEVDSLGGPVSQPIVGSTTPLQSLGNLATLEEMMTFATLEMAIALHAMDPAAYTPDADVADYLLSFADSVQQNGGYYGPLANEPFFDGYYPTSMAMVHEGGAFAELNRIVADADLWEDDQWVRGWSVDAGPPPTSLDDHVERTRRALSEARALVDDRFERRFVELVERRDGASRSATALTWGAAALALVGLVALLGALGVVLRRMRSAMIDNTRDPLTGIGNRKQLDSEIAPRLQDPQLKHHVVVTLDMDRFKTINDVYGHGFGDRMLEIVGAGLAAMSNHVPEVPGVAVRIGGDEFLISFHSANEIPLELVNRAMNRLRSTIVSAPDGTLVRCNFSYGVVAAEGTPDLRSLMTASDLAAYSDKSRTSQSRWDSDRVNS